MWRRDPCMNHCCTQRHTAHSNRILKYIYMYIQQKQLTRSSNIKYKISIKFITKIDERCRPEKFFAVSMMIKLMVFHQNAIATEGDASGCVRVCVCVSIVNDIEHNFHFISLEWKKRVGNLFFRLEIFLAAIWLADGAPLLLLFNAWNAQSVSIFILRSVCMCVDIFGFPEATSHIRRCAHWQANARTSTSLSARTHKKSFKAFDEYVWIVHFGYLPSNLSLSFSVFSLAGWPLSQSFVTWLYYVCDRLLATHTTNCVRPRIFYIRACYGTVWYRCSKTTA